jgi:hypothetical protein
MMLYLAYPFAAIASLVIDILCKLILNRIVVLFADDNGNLPRALKWFQTFDATLDEGMYARRNELAAGLGGDTWAAFIAYPSTPEETYQNREKWLFRNTGYGFDYYLLGVRWNPNDWRVIRFVETDALLLFIAVGNGFNIYIESRYGMVKLGWKAWNLFNRNTRTFSGSWGDDNRIPITFSLTPFKRRG